MKNNNNYYAKKKKKACCGALPPLLESPPLPHKQNNGIWQPNYFGGTVYGIIPP